MQLCLCTQHGETALHLAASGGHLDVVKLLCEKGMNVNVQDKVSCNFFIIIIIIIIIIITIIIKCHKVVTSEALPVVALSFTSLLT